MNLTAEKFEAMKIAYDMAFKNAFEAAPTTYEQFCMIVGDSAHTTVKLPFMEQFSCMRKWLGARQIKNLEGKMITMTEDAYEETVGIKVREIETDNWGMYMTAIQQMAVAAKALWDQLAAAAILDPATWIDNKAFFATDRKYGKSTICNKTTSALSAATFKTAWQTMQSYCGHAGEPLAVQPDVLMVGPGLEFAARDILENEYEIDGQGKITVKNSCKGLAKLIINKRFVGSYANHWRLMSCGGPIKPIALQKSKEAALISKNKPDDEGVFMEDQAIFGTAAYGSAAAAFPHLVYAGVVS